MSDKNNNHLSAGGDGNAQVVGDNNTVTNNITIIMSEAFLPPSLVRDLLDVVHSLPKSSNTQYSLEMPALMQNKLKFNNAPRYMRRIKNHSNDYACVDEVMKDYANSETIITTLHDMFIDVASLDDDGNLRVDNGDEQLQQMEDELFKIIVQDSRSREKEYPQEKIRHFCIALIACGISKCEILLKPSVQNVAT
ncbi:unnamed protein product [Cylicostephanus goldi]|uniref:Uncharacterized protein n=1 Tax=Cylicostephanus goldi TaxID=71465 RepID=A0A3P7N3V1_CYLGO|nr:unnamed protein product [Cylicostephanus goldi]